MALHKDQTGANLHEPIAIATALVDKVYVADGAGSGDFKFFKPRSVELVNAMTDFPAAVAGVRTLLDNKIYVVGTSISTADRFVLGVANMITSLSIEGPKLTYTGTDAMFTGVDKNFQVDQANLDCPNGTVLDMSGTGGTGFIRFDKTRVNNAVKLGKFTNMIGVVFSRCALLNLDDGIELLGANQYAVVSVEKLRTTTTSATYTFLDLGTIETVTCEVTDIIFDGPAGAVAIKGATGSANIAANKLAIVASCEFDPDMTALSGLTIEDIRWEFRANSGLANSIKATDTFITASEVVTIGSAGVFVAIGGTAWTSDISSRFTTTSAGVLTYISEQDSIFLVSGVATIEKVVGGTDVLEMRIAKNGTTIPKSGSFTEAATPTTVSSQALLSLTKNDTLQLFVANNTSAGNIDVNIANLTARASG